ncbi:MAG: TRAP transporter large permease subunit [Anaerolineae bacterium]|nr:TRAP transporter large permease subunit [Anaerolineae bacterium]
MTIALIIAGLALVLSVGIPIAFGLGTLGLLMIELKGLSPLIIPQSLFGAIDSFVLLSVPLFLLMSNILLKAGVGKDLYGAVQSWIGHWPGGLAIATIVSCAIFSAISGTSVATVATVGVVAIREMTERGYDRRFTYGLLAAGGTLGILIPPSIPMIVYGAITEESIGSLFLAGIGPGLLMAGLFIVYSMLYASFGAGCRPAPRASWSERLSASIRALPTVGLALIMVGGIYSGIFTPTEASAVGCVAALVLAGPILRTLTLGKLKEAVHESMRTTVTIFLIIAGAQVFTMALTLYRVPQDVSLLISSNVSVPAMFVLVVCIALLIMGCFFESMSMLLIMVPVLFPALAPLGIDPILFAVIFVIMVECGLITPPLGLNLFIVQSIAGAPLRDVAMGSLPFVTIMLLTLVLVYAFPGIALHIPFQLWN